MVLAETAYLVLLSNEPDRSRRQDFMQMLATQACHRVSTKQLIAIASEGAQLPGRSFDATVLAVDKIKAEFPVDPSSSFFSAPKADSKDEWS